MTARHRLLLGSGALLLPVLLSPLLLQPTYAIAFACAVAAFAIAARGVAYPLALSAIFSIFIGILGHNPFPNGVIAKLSFVWIAVAILFAVVRDDDVLPARVLLTAPVVLSVATATWMTVRLGASNEQQYGSFKLQLFLAENVAFLIAGIIVARRRDHFRLFLVLTLAMAGLSALVLAHGLASGQAQAVVGGRFALSSDYNPIIFGRDAARAITIAVFFLLVARLPWLRLISIAMLPLLAVSFTAAGSRGPALGLVVGLLALLSLTLREREARRRVLAVAAGGLAGAFLVAQLVPGQNVSRSLSFLTGNTSDASSNGRTALWHIAWHTFLQHPLAGIGTGGYAGVDPNNLYPHNLVLETLAEQGAIGGVLVVGTIVLGAARLVSTWRASTGRDQRDAAIVASLLAAAVVNAMFSGDIAVNNAIWLTLGLALGLRLRTAAVPAFPERVAQMRALRKQPRPRRGLPAARPQPGRPPRGAAPVTTGRILSPSTGTVGGLVAVTVEAARTGRPVGVVRLEWAQGDGHWQAAGEADDRAFDVATGVGAAAVVRGEWLADLIAAALGVSARPSRRRPWGARPTYEIEWDASVFAPGPGRLRAVTVDVEGTSVASDPVELTVAPAEHAAAARDDRAEIVRRLRDRQAIAERTLAELAAREQAVAKERAALAARAAELDEVERRVRAIAKERAALEARASELADLEARAASLTRAQEELAAREHAVAKERAALEARASELADVEARAASLTRERQELEDRARELTERQDALAAARAELEQRESAVAERERQAQALAERPRRNPVVALSAPGRIVRGALELEITAHDVDEAPRVEVAEGAGWRIVATRDGSLDTRALPDGPTRLRAAVGEVVSDPVVVVVDNTPPTVSIVRPADGDELSGIVTPNVDATDDGSGVDSILLQRSHDGAAWRPVPNGRWDTTKDEDGAWMIRATAVDGARNVGRSEIVHVTVRNAEPEPTPDPAPLPEPAFEPESVPESAPARVALGVRPTLFELEEAVAAVGDPLRREELDAILFFLRDYADVDGVLPTQFDALVAQEFGL